MDIEKEEKEPECPNIHSDRLNTRSNRAASANNSFQTLNVLHIPQ